MMTRSVLVICCLAIFTSWLFPATSWANQAYQAEVGSCTKASTSRAMRRAKHLYFSIEEGRKLWKELGSLRIQKKQFKLVNTKLELKDDLIAVWRMRFNAAEKTVIAQKEQVKQQNLQIQQKDKKIQALTSKWNQAEKDAAKYRGQRYEFLVWGVVGGVVVTAVVVGAVVIAVK